MVCPNDYSPVLHEPRETEASSILARSGWPVEVGLSREQAEISAKRASPANAVGYDQVLYMYLVSFYVV